MELRWQWKFSSRSVLSGLLYIVYIAVAYVNEVFRFAILNPLMPNKCVITFDVVNAE